MIYAMSDIHGEYERFLALLEQIRFGPDDTLYILGDLVDRGPQPMRLIQDIAARDNVYALLGNHDAAARELLRALMVEITGENCETHLDAELMSRLSAWLSDGGETTLRTFRALSPDQRLDVLDYLDDLPHYEVVDAGDRTFILVHAGLGNFSPSRPLRSYLPDELLLARHVPSQPLYPDPSILLVTGHTPTLSITGLPRIHRDGSHLCIDCGAVFGGRLACLCLDTLAEYYA